MIRFFAPRLRLLGPIAALSLLLSGCASGPIGGEGSLSSEPISAVGLAAHTRAQEAKLLPRGFDYPEIFDGYWDNSMASWARNWTRRFDLTGIAWDKPQAGVLISPRHVLFAAHFGRGPGSMLVFHDRKGKPVARILEAVKKLGDVPLTDVLVGVLDEDIPLRHYRVLPPREDWASLLPNASVFLADSERKLLNARVAGVGPGLIRFTHAGTPNPRFVEDLITGDSGHPAFLPIDGELVLLETHTGGGAGRGPFFSDPIVFASINRAMLELGGGYQLETVPLER